jgi:diguanylate cyclase (GGDEF)-like protein
MDDSLPKHERFAAFSRSAAASPPPRLPFAPVTFDGWRAALLTTAALAAVAVTAWFDWATGPDLSLSIFYLIPVAACAWWCGFTDGILLSLAGAVAWYLVDALENPLLPPYIGLWNGVVRFGTLVIISSLVARLHLGVRRERLLARTDALTGAANGRTFYEMVSQEAERAARGGHPLTLAYLDLDHFKQLNDRLGHAAGDAALVDLVRMLQHNLRAADVLARLGGDEFALLLPETDSAGAVALLSRLQAVVAQEMARTGRHITLSVGAVTFVEPLWDVDLMVQQVDALMYSAKRRGKNRIEHTTVHDIRDFTVGERQRLERRATARTVCNHEARVRREGDDPRGERFATVHDISTEGLGLRLGKRYPDGCVLIVEPLAAQAKTLLARVMHSRRDDVGWLHGCELSTCLSADELEAWLSAAAPSKNEQ